MKAAGITGLILCAALTNCTKVPSVGEVCASHGFTPGTPEFFNCSMRVSEQRQRAAMALWGMQTQNQALQTQQNQQFYNNPAMQSLIQPRQFPSPAQYYRPSTTCSFIGSTMFCN
jgi:hypothetical protein